MLLLLSTLIGCGTSGTPTRSSEEVLGTAQLHAEHTRQVTLQTPPPTPITPSATPPLITDTPVPTVTPTPSTPIATANYNAFVRSGPDEAYSHIDFFLEGQSAEIFGRYDNPSNGTWWFIRRIEAGRDGWVWGGAVTIAGDVEAVLHLEPPPIES